MSDGKVRWRDDPLSLFLLVSAVLLGAIYLLEERGVTELAEASAHARALGAKLEVPCVADSAGAAGNILVLDCTTDRATAAASVAQQLTTVDPFGEVVIAAADGRWRCPPNLPDWPATCVDLPAPVAKK